MNYSKNQLTKTSKFLSFVLRHKPEAIDLQLDDSGWALISELISKSDNELKLTHTLIEQTVIMSEKNRFLISDNGLSIRANQGHSIKVDLQLTPKKPPHILFHGTATRFLESIQKEGLKAGQRHHVHLSTDIDTAIDVGKRYGNPVVIKIPALKLHQNGLLFFQTNNNVWLTKYINPDHLTDIQMIEIKPEMKHLPILSREKNDVD